MSKQRKQDLLEMLKTASGPLNGQHLAEIFQVTRQIIVQDIALLRADGAPIISTNRGYLYQDQNHPSLHHRLFKLQHEAADIEEELLAIVDNGGRLQNIMVEHPVYGEIQTHLKISSRRDIRDFMQQVQTEGFRPLSELTEGVHYHLVQADTQQDLDYIQEALSSLGFLVD